MHQSSKWIRVFITDFMLSATSLDIYLNYSEAIVAYHALDTSNANNYNHVKDIQEKEREKGNMAIRRFCGLLYYR